ncbi:NADH-quinone oxidoreductase subunit C/D [Porticoccaceae bacterium]|jgi:NADH-quinone oxidoreductase subunit C/D|nr:NADH-quinone oxidoreductase subunit C/D [Porticoccaceae bacterium]MCT2534026.1 NADH-quinone oxidoreductase subunit C/D [SAR92 clade bacterium H231]MBT6318554.1 NADH-quinone oxidoreductase subunit C/D [Porticoccaceae bacterium]MBT7259094.1 NADH-quinone oxidoreductase subunit C/D [Porticoccaceae bacterium]MBT7905508.1 NADH-quinone oxidoreductase subunit C/D [Porticoccaceae bacterium]
MQTAETLVHSQVEENLYRQFGEDLFVAQYCADKIPTVWVSRKRLIEVLEFLKPSFSMLYDLFAIDERTRVHRDGQPNSDFTVVYQLLSMERNQDLRIKVALAESDLSLPTIIAIWPNANWYEREAWDMFGVDFTGHPNLFRILLPPTWEGHALRKDHPARATEMAPFEMGPERVAKEQEALRFRPEDWGMKAESEDSEFMFLNLGPNHPSVHGVFRIALQLDGEVIMDSVPDIGYHHRGAEKMAERQTWHTFIPYSDRIDYLGGVMNNLAYIQSVETLAGIEVPERAKVIRIMLAELFRISSHLVFYGTFVQDVGQMSPVFYMFVDREKLFGIVEAITGGRMHPAWFRIGGVAQDLPNGWDRMIREFLDYLPARLDHYDKMAMQNKMLKERTVGIGVYTQQEALDWGVTGPGLRATGSDWDVRKKRPYGGYDQFDFEVPTAENGDCYDRAVLRIEEMRQSLKIIRQCVDNMPSGPYKSEHSATTPPPKERTMEDIETLIHHFLNVSWGPVIPEGEASVMIEATKGINSYHLISDRSTNSYRTRIRTPSFPHLQQIPLISKGLMIPDLIAIIASIDFVMADVDR